MHDTQTRAFLKFIGAALVAFVLAAILPLIAHAAPDGALLAGTVKSAAGPKLSGVTVSAKMDGTTITTSVFTDEEGAYYFPAMNAGHYDVWAQADGFEIARGIVDLTATKHHDFVLKATSDFGRPDARFAAGPDAGRPQAEARLSQQLHQLPPTQLHSSEQVRRTGLDRDYGSHEARQCGRRLSWPEQSDRSFD
jgi:Carboxypeptidase regulatory-like domain